MFSPNGVPLGKTEPPLQRDGAAPGAGGPERHRGGLAPGSEARKLQGASGGRDRAKCGVHHRPHAITLSPSCHFPINATGLLSAWSSGVSSFVGLDNAELCASGWWGPGEPRTQE